MNTNTRVKESLGSLRPSRLVIAIYAAASLIGAFIAFSSATGALDSMLMAAVAATVVAVALLVMARLLPWSSWVVVPFRSGAFFLLIAVFVGVVRGLVLVQLSGHLGIELDSGAGAQVINSMVSAVVWLTLAGLIVGSRERYRRKYRALLLHGDVDTDWDTHPSVQQVKTSVSQALGTSDQRSATDLVVVAEAIRREIDMNIRPLSHRLWFGAEGEEPRSRLSALVRDAIASWTIPVRTVLVIWCATALLGGARWLGGEVAVLAAVISTVILAVVIVVVRRFLPESAVIRGFALGFGSTLVILGTDLVLRGLGYPSRIFEDLPLLVLLPISVGALLVASAAIALAESDRRLVLDVAEYESQAIAKLRRQSAYLHNSLQSELTGMAMQLDEAARSGSSEEARAALERVHALLARSISEDFASFQEDPMARITRVIDGWRGICTVRIDVTDAALSDARMSVCVQAVEEVIANAVRHAGATVVDVHVEWSEQGLGVQCRSDGGAPTSSGSGLGSQVLAAVAPRGVIVEPLEVGASLRFVIE